MCDCFHLAFPNWHAASSETGGGRRLRGAEPVPEDNSICDEPSQFTEGERPRPQGSSPVDEYPEMDKYTDSDKECEAEHDPHRKGGGGKKSKKSGLGSMFEKRSTSKTHKLKEAHSPESEVIVKTAQDGGAEGLIYGGGGREGLFIKEVVPESPASKSLKLKEGDQVLSATVYFDNVPYEDAIQILEHAQAYKVKLCLKRKPDITDTEPILESDVIPEDDTFTPEMREPGKTKRRSDARISWPKFHTLGRKSNFTRSHSSSEADEQRKLELSPPTSDTESPIKSQDAVKGKKKNKIRLSFLKKRGRVGSSEDLDTDTATTGKMLSPECVESSSGETPDVYVTGDLKAISEDLQNEQNLIHKSELITIDSTLKTEDLTVALANQESPSGAKSPEGKKKKKERSELKIKILGKDKSHKKEAKAKASPKRLKTLGASIEVADQLESEKSNVIPSVQIHKERQGDEQAPGAISAKQVTSLPKVELEISDVAIVKKSPKKEEAKTKKDKDNKQKQETKTFKLPKIGFGDIAIEEDIQKTNVNIEDSTTKIVPPTSDVKDDPYERLSKSSLSKTQLPKREDIEIPGMEDLSRKTTARGTKEPKVVYTGHYDEITSETMTMSIDVDSVKEAVSKLPGFKLPKVDTSGVLIPEEITVIDANAQRISVKTPTKVVDTKSKHETHFTRFDTTASASIPKTTVKLPKIAPDGLASEVLLIETKIEKKDKPQEKWSDKEMKTEVYKREDIIIPGKESAAEEAGALGSDDKTSKKAKRTTSGFGIAMPDIKVPDIGFDFRKQNLNQENDDNFKGERTIFLQEVQTSKIETKKAMGHIGGAISDVKVPEIDGIQYIDSASGSPVEKIGGIGLTGFGVNLDASMPNADISFPEIKHEVKYVEAKEHTSMDITIDPEISTIGQEGQRSKFKIPNLGLSMPKVKGRTMNTGQSEKGVDVALTGAKAEAENQQVPRVEVTLGGMDVSIPEKMVDVERSELEIKTQQTELKLNGQESKIKMPELGIKMPKFKGPQFDFSVSKKGADAKLREANAEVKPSEAPEIDVKKPDLELKPPQTEGKLDRDGGKIKMPKIGITMPKLEGPEIDMSFSNKDANVIPEAKPEVEIPKGPQVSVDKQHPKSEPEIDVQGSKVTKLEITMPKVKLPEIDFSLSKKDVDVKLPEAKADVRFPDAELKAPSAKVDFKVSKGKSVEKNTDGSPSKFKMPSIKMPKFGGVTQNTGVEISKKNKGIPIPETQLKPLEEGAVEITAPSIDIKGPSLDVKKTQAELDGKGHKKKMPKFGASAPKLKGPEFDSSVSLPETTKVNVEMKPPQFETDGTSGEFKIPTFGINLPKVKGPELDLSLSKTDVDMALPQPKVGIKLPDAPNIDVSLGKAEVTIPEAMVKVEQPEVELKPLETDVEFERKDGKFKMPKFGISMPKVKGPEIDFNFTKKDLTLSEANAEVKLPDVDLKKSSAEGGIEAPAQNIDIVVPSVDVRMTETEGVGKEGKFKVPKFGISLPKVQGPKIDASSPKKVVDVKLPDVEAQFPEAPEIDVKLGKVNVSIPEAKIEVKNPQLESKTLQSEGELAGQESKFKMPKFGISMPKVKGPEFDFSLSKTDVDTTQPSAKAEVILPDVKLKEHSAKVEIKAPEIEAQSSNIKASPSKFKMPTFKFPKFGATTPNVSTEVPDMDKNLKIEGADLQVSVPSTDIDLPKVEAEVNLPEVEVKVDGERSKFKMPKFGFTMPEVTGPEIDFSLSKKEVDVTLPEAKADVKLPDVELKKPSAELEIKAPEIKMAKKDTEISPSKYKLPTFKLPKFGVGMPSAVAEVPETNKDLKIDGADIKIPEEVLTVDIEGSSIDMKMTGTEHEGKSGKFKMPKFGITMPKVSGPEIDINLSKKERDVTLPEAKAEVKLPEVELQKPSAEVEFKAPEMKVQTKDKEGSPSKFKMPTFKLPKFGVSIPSATVELPETNKDLKIDGFDVEIKSEDVPQVDIKAPSIDIEGPSIELKTTGTEHVGKGSKFKMPSLGFNVPQVKGPDIDLSLSKKDVNVTLPEVKAEVKLPDVRIKEPSAELDIKDPEIKVAMKSTVGSPTKFKMPTFKLPKFGVSLPSATVEVPETNKDVKIHGGEIKIPEEVLTVAAPILDIEGRTIEMQSTGAKQEVKGSEFKMPKFGITMPNVKGPEIDLSSSTKNVELALPEVTAEVKLPDVELQKPSAEVEFKSPEIKLQTKEGSPSKFKMPTFKLPKFGMGSPSAHIELPETNKELKIDGADVKISEEVLEVGIAAPNIDIEGPSMELKTTGTDHVGKGSKFKMPSLGFNVPHVKQPDIDISLSKKDVNVTLPEVEAEVKLPDVKVKEPSADLGIKAPEIKVATKNTDGSPSKYKMPTLKLPKFGVSMPSANVEVPETNRDLKLDGADINIPEKDIKINIAAPSIDIEGPSIDMKTSVIEHPEKGSKFKMPKLGISKPKVKGPDIDINLSKKDIDVTLPEAKADVKLPELELQKPSAEVEFKEPEIKLKKKDKDGSPSKFKMPTFKLPKFGMGSPSAHVELPATNKDLKIDGGEIIFPEEVLTVAAPNIEIEGPTIEMQSTGTEQEVKGSKFKMPKFGITMPNITGPEINLSSSTKNVDMALPEATAEVKLPDVELQKPSVEVEFKSPEIKVQTKDKDGSPSKYKMPTFKLPKFGVSMSSATVEVPETNKDLKIDGADMNIPEEDLKINIAAPSIDIKGPSIDMKTSGTEHPEKGSKFKMPKLGVSMPKVKGPDIDINLSKKDVDVTLPEAKAEVQLPDVELKKPSAELEIKAPEIKVAKKDTEVSPSKYKLPTFKLPKFGVNMPSANVEAPETNKDLKIDGADMNIPEEDLKINIAAPSIDIKGPSIDMKTSGTEHPEKGSKFKMPKLGVSMPKVKGPDIDINLSKKDVDVTLPEAKADVKLPDVELKKPSAELEIKAPEIKMAKKDTEISPSKYKLPTFKLPKFGVGMPSAVAEVPETNKDLKIDGADIKIPEEVLTVDIEGSSIDMKMTGTEHEGKSGKFKMPKFGITMPKVSGPEIDINLSKKERDVTLPEAKAEVKLPEVELQKPSAEVEFKAPEMKVQTKDKEGSPSKFKMPTFKLPKFGVGTPSATIELPETNKDLTIDGADLKLSEEVLTVDIAAPHIDIEGQSKDMKTKGIEHEGKGSKFKMPSLGFSVSQVQHPDIDLSLSKKDVDVKLPEAKAMVQISDVEPSTKVEVITPQVHVQTSNTEGSPTKFKMPTFKLPKFGAAQVSVEVPAIDKNIEVEKEKLEVSKEGVTMDVKGPSADIEGLSVDLKSKGSEMEGSGSKFKMPTFGISMPKVKGPEIDVSLSNRDVNVTLPEASAEVKLPEVEFKEPATAVPDAPTVEVEGKFRRPSWTFPKFSFSRTGAKAPDGDMNFETAEVDASIEVAKEDPCPPDVEVQGPSGAITTEELPAVETDANLKKSRFSLPRLSFSKSSVKEPEVSAELPHVDVSLPEGEVVVTQPQLENIAELETVNDGKESKIKMPTFGFSMPKVKGPEIDVSLSNRDVNVTLPEASAEVKLPEVEFKEPKDATAVPDAPTVEVEGKFRRPSWTFPKFSFSRTSAKASDGDMNFETAEVDVSLEVAKDPCPPDVEVQGPSGAITTEELPAVETDANLKKSRFSLPRLSFSKSSVKEPEVSAELPHVDVSLPEGEVIVTQPQLENITELETEYDGQGSKFKLPKFGIALPKAKEPQEEFNASQKDIEIKLPEVKAEVKLPEIEVKSASSVDMKASDTEAKAKDIGGSPLKLKGPSVEFKTDVETPTTETESQGSPSKFKLPSFKMPKMSFSKPKPEDQSLSVEAECLEEQLEIKIEAKEENKSPKMTFTSIGEMFQNFDVEFDVPKTDIVGENLENSKEVHKVDEPSGKLEENETNTKQDTPKSPERTGWFKFPRFGLSSPTEPPKIPGKDKTEKSPEGETVDESVSPTCSVQSSDAFADISSAMTSEHVGMSLSSPTKVTVKYSDPNTGIGEVHSKIITSTTRTELISVEPNLPEKITILSSGVSSSSEDTLRLESGKIHIITSNIEATPEAQHAKLLTTVQVQSVGGLPLRSEGDEAASWTVEDSKSSKKTVFERHLVTETSSERSESKETVVITKQITRMLDSAEHISGETASSIQRLRETVHSDKMRFFDEAEK